jgi:hypothetical protein
MTHEEAIREQAAEQYLLGELSEEARAQFEEHFFDCTICAADIAAGAQLVDALRVEGSYAGPAPRQMHLVPKRTSPWMRPWLVPALAASLLVIAYQNVLELPHLRRQAAVAQTPAVASNVVLANISARGASSPTLVAPAHGSFLLSVDIPSSSEYTSYICALYNASGDRLWQVPVTAQQAENTVSLIVPTDKAAPDGNELRVLGVPHYGGGAPVEVGRYRFDLQISR